MLNTQYAPEASGLKSNPEDSGLHSYPEASGLQSEIYLLADK
jgi:hypothetical protein